MPTIVIDFCSITKTEKSVEDFICGGGSEIDTSPWNGIFAKLSSAGYLLVFFSDPRLDVIKDKHTVQEDRDRESLFTRFIEQMESGKTLQGMCADVVFPKTVTSNREMRVICRRYGEFRYSVMQECDLELAQYAYSNDVVAVMSNDTDFLFYVGPWKLWWIDNDESAWNEFNVTEYDRTGLNQLFRVNRKQLPLLATLLGNQFTRTYQSEFSGLKRSDCAASYVRRIGSDRLTDFDIRRIAESAFKKATQSQEEIQQSIRKSLQFYDLETRPPALDDELVEKLRHIPRNGVDMYRLYRQCMRTHYKLSRYCNILQLDVHSLLMEWMKRRAGVVRQRFADDDFELTISEEAIDHVVKPSYPTCKKALRTMCASDADELCASYMVFMRHVHVEYDLRVSVSGELVS